MATIDLGKIKMVWRGAYDNATAYTPDDVVSSGGASYICILASTGNAVSNTTYWNVLAQAGTDGTDVGTTLTTEGDLLYRDGSGLQRLAKPGSTMFLQMTSGGVPSWSALSTDVVKLADINLSTASSSVSIDGYFTSDYKIYEVIIHHLQAPSWLKTRLNISGSADTTNSYSNYNDYVKVGGSSGEGTWGVNNDSAWYGPTYWSTNTNPYGYFRFILVDPLNTSRHKIMYMPEMYEMHSTTMYMSSGGGRFAKNDAVSGITFFVENGNNYNYFKGALYGYKQAE